MGGASVGDKAGNAELEPEADRPARLPVLSRLVTATQVYLDHGSEPRLSRPEANGGDPGRTTAAPRWLVVIAGLTVSLALAWIAAVALSVNHGYDLTDEGYYLLAYRWWSTTFRTGSDVQIIYGPVFALLGHNIALLRLFRLATVVGTTLVFGWAFMRWLRLQRPAAPPSRLWELTGVAAIVAAGGMAYSWLPLSPGYNDVSMLGALLAVAVVLRVATHVQRGTPIRVWLAVALGPLAVAMLLAKWASSALTLAAVAVVGVILLAPRGRRAVLRVIGWTVGAAVATAALIQVLLVPLTTALPQMLAVNRVIAAGTNSPTSLISMYYDTSVIVLKIAIDRCWPLLVVAALAVVLRDRRGRVVTGLLGVAALWRTVHMLYLTGGYKGGTGHLGAYPLALLTVFLAALVIGVVAFIDRVPAAGRQRSSLTRTTWRNWTLLALLAILPLTQAAGTGNPLFYMVFNCFAGWLALMIVVATGIEGAPLPARGLAAAVVTIGVVLVASIGTNGVLRHPYRTHSYLATTTVPAGVPALSSIKLDPATAAAYSALYAQLRPYVRVPGRAVMAFDEMSGVVLALDGRSVGEPWYSTVDRARSAAGIRAECAGGHPFWGDRLPIVIFNRLVTQVETDALDSCGLSLLSDYRLLPRLDAAPQFQVYVPAREVT